MAIVRRDSGGTAPYHRGADKPSGKSHTRGRREYGWKRLTAVVTRTHDFRRFILAYRRSRPS